MRQPPTRMRAVLLAAALAAACPAVLAQGSEADMQRWVGASTLNLRAAALPAAELVGRLRINQPVRLQQPATGRWCEVQALPAGPRGFVDCTFLVATPVTLAQIEAEVAEHILALHRLAGEGAGRGSFSVWGEVMARQPAEARRLLEALFQQVDRHFALSPSMRTYADADGFISLLRKQLPPPGEPGPEPIRQLLDSRVALLPAMRQALSADFAGQSLEPVRRSLTGTLASLVERRQSGKGRSKRRGDTMESPAPASGAGEAPPAVSFFSQGRWAAGWAGGPMAQHLAGPLGEGAAYALRYNGYGPWTVSDVIEMAKVHHAAVNTRFGVPAFGTEADLSQTPANAEGRVDTVTVATQLVAWGITDRGLVRGSLRKIAFGGDSCSGESARHTAAEVVFDAPVSGPLHGVFLSSAPIDAAKARVLVSKRRFLAPLFDLWENTLTETTRVRVDLDGDGVPDLRVVVSEDSAVADGPRVLRVGLQRVAGWYANNVYSMEANEDGRWRTLSLYDVVTCT